jgi:hypothetical protein
MTGAARVRLRDGRVYIGSAYLGFGVLTMPAGRLRTRDVCGEHLYPPRAKSWAASEWVEVEWDSAPEIATAA